MADSVDDVARSGASGDGQSAQLISVEIVSPSPAVPSGLSFSDLPVTTTVQQLKEKIRGRLLIPNPEEARLTLIFLGKVLSRPDATLQTALSAGPVPLAGRCIIHLAIVKEPDGQSFSFPGSASLRPDSGGESLSGDRLSQDATERIRLRQGGLELGTVRSSRGNHFQAAAAAPRQELGQGSSPVSVSGTQWRVTINTGFTPANPQYRAMNFAGREAAARAARALETFSVSGGGGPSPSTAGRQHPDAPLGDLPGALRAMSGQQGQQLDARQSGPEVYILNSPSGPEAILINTNNTVYFSTPDPRRPGEGNLGSSPFSSALERHAMDNSRRRSLYPPHAPPEPQPQPLPVEDTLSRWQQAAQRRHDEARRRHLDGEQRRHMADFGHQIQQRHGAGGGAGLPLLQRPHNRPNNAGAAAALAAVWPHAWWLARMILLVWWVTSPDTSWTRWLTVVAAVVAVLIVNTGALNGFAENAWQPFRRHLERLLLPPPAAAANGGNRPQNANAPPARPQAGTPGNDIQSATAADATRQAPPNPQDAAARLVAQRREANATWLMDQVRRLERAGLLFVASIAPGVAERHIAHLEAEARRVERERREAEAAAAARQAEAEANERGLMPGAEAAAEHNNSESGVENSTGRTEAEGAPRVVLHEHQIEAE